jgi:putative nucleotidyltransferase with HDIG domain
VHTFFNKTIVYFVLGGVCSFIVLSFFHDGLDTTINFQSYIVPILIGGLIGSIMGLMQSRLGQRTKRSEEFFLNIIETLAVTIDERDGYTHGHSRRVTAMALHLGTKMGLRFQDLQQLKLAALLHDIGKIGMSDSVLHKPGRLTGDESSQKEEHPQNGARILERMRDGRIVEVIKCVRHHHERYDGTGYPDSLKGEAIPLFARIVAVADSYDAMTSDRPYQEAMTTEEAVAEIVKGAGTQFEPEIVKSFVSLMGDKQHPKECPFVDSCRLFPKIIEREISKAYEMQYCTANYQGCKRFTLAAKGRSVSDSLLPDGEMF